MNYLDVYKVTATHPYYLKHLEDQGFTSGQMYISVGFVKNEGRVPPTILLINRNGLVKGFVYSDNSDDYIVFEKLIEETVQ